MNVKLPNAEQEKRSAIRINTSLRGEPAEWLLEWKTRGLVTSNTDALLQAFRAFHEKITEQDLRQAQLRTLSKDEG